MFGLLPPFLGGGGGGGGLPTAPRRQLVGMTSMNGRLARRIGPVVYTAASAGATLVQTSGQKNIVNTSNASDTLAAAGNFAAGSTVVIAIVSFNDAATVGSTHFSSVTVSGTAAVEDAAKTNSGNQSYRVSIWRATNVAGGNPNVVLNWFAGGGGPTHYATCSFEEWTGVNLSPVDQVPTAVQSTGTTQSITSGVTAQASELVYAACNVYGVSSSLTGPTSGFTQTVLETGATNLNIAAGYKKVSSSGAQSASWAMTSHESDAVMVTYETV